MRTTSSALLLSKSQPQSGSAHGEHDRQPHLDGGALVSSTQIRRNNDSPITAPGRQCGKRQHLTPLNFNEMWLLGSAVREENSKASSRSSSTCCSQNAGQPATSAPGQHFCFSNTSRRRTFEPKAAQAALTPHTLSLQSPAPHNRSRSTHPVPPMFPDGGKPSRG